MKSLFLSRLCSRWQLILLTALWISIVPNWPTLQGFIGAASAGTGLVWFAFVTGGWLFILTVIVILLTLLSLIFIGQTLRWLCIAALICAAILSYFTAFLGTQFDKNMLINMLQTHQQESLELITPKLLVWVLLVGLLPAFWVFEVRLKSTTGILPRLSAVWGKPMLLCAVTAVVSFSTVYAMYPRYASAARNGDISFHQLAPANVFAAGVSYGYDLRNANRTKLAVGLDAAQKYPLNKPRLVVFILGETTRAQNVGLNGYSRDTMPHLRQWQQAGGLYFKDTQSCGTATAISVPCIFSGLGREQFNLNQANGQENLIDVIARTGARVIWRDNDSGCKGVCEKADFTDYTSSQDPAWCPEPGNCLDEILLQGLPQKLQEQSKDTLLVLHLKSSHGPAYFKRYPPAFERFTPTCQSNDLSACPVAHIQNAYDNTIVYTDHVINEVIKLTQSIDDQFASTVLYASDHGESLGESGVFLHGLPYGIAPKEQTTVPMFAWLSPQFTTMEAWSTPCLRQTPQKTYSHDHIYATILGLMDIKTQQYQRGLDIFSDCDLR